MTSTRDFRKWCNWLRRTFPLRLAVPYSIHLVDPERIAGTDGFSWHYTDGKERYVSFVASGMDAEKTIEALIHEYAHVTAWQLPPALGVLEDDDEIHSLIMQRINRRWYRWMKDRGVS